MSSYERYDRDAALVHQRDRPPVGVEFIAAALRDGGARVGRLLDAGCGTGSYGGALRPLGCAVTCLDLSRDMLAAARGRVDDALFVRGGLGRLPFGPSTFDAVLLCQVLHHLESGEDPCYRASLAALREAARVLRPDGALVLNVCTHEQLRTGFWYYSLVPEAVGAALRRCVPARLLTAALDSIGLTERRTFVPSSPMQGEAYLDPRGPLDPDWRRTDSIWALVSAAELERAQRVVRELDVRGELDDHVRSLDRSRQRSGQLTIIVARRRTDAA